MENLLRYLLMLRNPEDVAKIDDKLAQLIKRFMLEYESTCDKKYECLARMLDATWKRHVTDKAVDELAKQYKPEALQYAQLEYMKIISGLVKEIEETIKRQ